MTNKGSRQTMPAGADRGRRDFLKTSLAATAIAATGAWPLAGSAAVRSGSAPKVVVVGAGVFGGWTALHLQRQGADVTLVDPWGPGNSRASSGGETRVIRGIYGADEIYVDWVLRSFELWRQAEDEWREQLYTPTGALWMFRGDDAYARSAVPLLEKRGLSVEKLEPAAARSRFPQIRFDGIQSLYYEPRAGFLAARQACRRLLEAFHAGGGNYVQARARPGPLSNTSMTEVALSGGGRLEADVFVFACGPWLGSLFPELLGPALRPTRQEVYFFGVPEDGRSYEPDRLPVWVDLGERVFYGIPGNMGRGFKLADDTRGETVDPTTMQRKPSADGIGRAREFLSLRFPALGDAPLVESRVCQYTNTADGHFVLDRHPEAGNVFIAGGGSGHGFKLGPAVGQYVAGLALGESEPMSKFSLDRLAESREERPQLSGGSS